MMVLYTGTPGSGKSLDAAHEIRYQLNKPRGEDAPVVCNFEVNTTIVKRPQAFTYVDNDELTPRWLMDFADNFWKSTTRRFQENYILCVIDEVQILWNSRTWTDKGTKGKENARQDWLKFFSQHRKYGFRIILITQNAKMMDNQFRMLCDFEINHRKVSYMGIVGALLGFLCRGLLFMKVKYLFQDNERLGFKLWLAHGKDLQMYDSYAKFRDGREENP